MAAPEEELDIGGMKLSQEDVDGAVKNRLLFKLRKAIHYMPDGKKAQTPSVIGKVLSDAQLLQLWTILSVAKTRGVPAYDQLAWRIQKEWHLLEEMSQWHVARAIMFYEQRIFGLLGVAESVPELEEWTKTKREAIAKIIEKVDGMESLSNLIQIQEHRISMAHEREKSISTLLPFLYKDIRVLDRVLATYLNFQMELGYVSRQPMKFDLTVKQGFSEQSRIVDQTVGRDPMLKATTKFLERVKTAMERREEVIDLDEIDKEIDR